MYDNNWASHEVFKSSQWLVGALSPAAVVRVVYYRNLVVLAPWLSYIRLTGGNRFTFSLRQRVNCWFCFAPYRGIILWEEGKIPGFRVGFCEVVREPRGGDDPGIDFLFGGFTRWFNRWAVSADGMMYLIFACIFRLVFACKSSCRSAGYFTSGSVLVAALIVVRATLQCSRDYVRLSFTYHTFGDLLWSPIQVWYHGILLTDYIVRVLSLWSSSLLVIIVDAGTADSVSKLHANFPLAPPASWSNP